MNAALGGQPKKDHGSPQVLGIQCKVATLIVVDFPSVCQSSKEYGHAIKGLLKEILSKVNCTTHARTHTHTHAYTQTHTCTHNTHTHIHTCTHTYTTHYV